MNRHLPLMLLAACLAAACGSKPGAAAPAAAPDSAQVAASTAADNAATRYASGLQDSVERAKGAAAKANEANKSLQSELPQE